MSDPAIRILGIRHHGPGSARSLVRALADFRPDAVLVEGPPDADDLIPFVVHAGLRPPVALLIYDPEHPRRAVYYPFAVFSPEWQALRYARDHGIPARFMDLPQSIQFARDAARESVAPAPALESDPSPASDPVPAPVAVRQDPLLHLARAAGHSDSERWWEHLVEHRRDSGDVFDAVLEAMTALREKPLPPEPPPTEAEREALREAHMRQMIRTALKDGARRLAVVCGAWHAPALAQRPPAREDAGLLKGQPKLKVAATWIPWTHGRLASASGYGAGVTSPGWYEFLWSRAEGRRDDVAAHWLARVARLLRDEDLDASSASVIEAVRLAESLAALRGHPLPGLPELTEATRSVFCFGDDLPLRLIARKLEIGEALGQVPDDTPAVPLARDLAREQKRLRLPPEANERALDLDLRKPNDLDRSRLLHRLTLLDVPWGRRETRRAQSLGTFHELWVVRWQPEFAVDLIEAGIWGPSIAAATIARIRHDADAAQDLPALTTLLQSTLLADLPEAAGHLMSRLQAVAAVASDVGHLMEALPPLAEILRYGNVRRTDADLVGTLVGGLVARVCIGLPAACASLADDAAESMLARLRATHAAVALLPKSELLAAWNDVLARLADAPGLHGLIGGRACRLLHESGRLPTADAARRLSFALSSAHPPAHAAAWIDGFLRDGGLLLLHDPYLGPVIDVWITELGPDHFTTVLPLLRRTFATFQPAERRQMGERVATTGPGPGSARTPTPAAVDSEAFDVERANRVLPLLGQLLGLEPAAPRETPP